jgi:hypothetical protein
MPPDPDPVQARTWKLHPGAKLGRVGARCPWGGRGRGRGGYSATHVAVEASPARDLGGISPGSPTVRYGQLPFTRTATVPAGQRGTSSSERRAVRLCGSSGPRPGATAQRKDSPALERREGWRRAHVPRGDRRPGVACWPSSREVPRSMVAGPSSRTFKQGVGAIWDGYAVGCQRPNPDARAEGTFLRGLVSPFSPCGMKPGHPRAASLHDQRQHVCPHAAPRPRSGHDQACVRGWRHRGCRHHQASCPEGERTGCSAPA